MSSPDVPADREAIRALLHEYCFRLDGGDLDGVAALFDHAEMGATTHDRRLRGADAVRTNYDAVLLYDDGTPCTQHCLSNTTIDIAADGDHATARSYFTVLQSRPDFELAAILAGEYRDRFARVDGQWQFIERIIDPRRIGDLSHHMRSDRVPERR
jgi:hypothetical protein